MDRQSGAHEPARARLPLAGIRVLDIASFIAAPVAATVLGDFGADVIKVEPPGVGDPNRSIMAFSAGYPKAQVNYPWHLDARGKRSIAIDLKDADARNVLDRLIATSDVLITNFPLAVRAKLRLGYEDVASVNPSLVYASFTGYGETGPDAEQLGFDVNAYFARSGILDGARYDGAPPAVVMPAQGDRAAALTLAFGIMMALWQRKENGKGTHVSSSLLANGIWSNGNFVGAALCGEVLPARPPPARPRSALSNVYQTSDDRWLQLSIVNEDRGWPLLCVLLKELALDRDARFSDTQTRRANAEALATILRDRFLLGTAADWSARLKAASIPFSLIARAEDVVEDPQAVAAGAIVGSADPDMPRTLAAPVSLASVSMCPPKPPPTLGQHSREILEEIGVGAAAIAELLRRGVVADARGQTDSG